MNDLLKTELVVDIGDGEGTSPPIAIEGDPGSYMGADLNAIHLLLICPAACHVSASVGTVSQGDTRTALVPAGTISFSGSNTSSLPKVLLSGISFKTLFAFNLKGSPTTISVHYDPKTYNVVASQPCHAVVSYTAYSAKARQLTYTPKMDALGSGSSVSGTSVTYGVIGAYSPPSSMITYQVQPATGPEQVDIEIYRRVSDALTTDEGQLEFPPNYPKDGKYPGVTYEADTSKCLQIERVHEIGIMGPGGHIGVRTYYVPICKPFVGLTSYTPKIRCVVSPLPPGLSASDVAKAKSKIAELGYGCT